MIVEFRDICRRLDVAKSEQEFPSGRATAPVLAPVQQLPQHVLARGRRGRGRAAARAEGARGASGQRSGSAHASSMPPPVVQCFAALQACTHCTHSLSHCTDASTRHFVFKKVVCVRAPRGSPRDCRRQTPLPAPHRRAAASPGAFNPRLQIYFYCGSQPPPRAPHPARPVHCILHGTPQCNLFAFTLPLPLCCSDSFHATCVVSTCAHVCRKVLFT